MRSCWTLMLRQLKYPASLAVFYWFQQDTNSEFQVRNTELLEPYFFHNISNQVFQMYINKKQISKCRPCNVQIMILLFQKFLECIWIGLGLSKNCVWFTVFQRPPQFWIKAGFLCGAKENPSREIQFSDNFFYKLISSLQCLQDVLIG
jgi:hypothetical protein